jgi:hypothetical protein
MQTALESLEKIQAHLVEIRELARATKSAEVQEILKRLADDIEAYARAIDQIA